MLIDCTTCVARDHACADCVVTVLLNRPALAVELDDAESIALERLADAGLVPPLRLVPVVAAGAAPPLPGRGTESPTASDSRRNGREIA